MSDKRLIERWLPIAEIGIESLRERTPMTPFPAPNRLHVWWARRPLVCSRAAVLASLLPSTSDHGVFLDALGIHGDPVAAKRLIAEAIRTGERVKDPYGYSRAFAYIPSQTEKDWISDELPRGGTCVLDCTAGGGSIPFEALRLGLPVFANDLNPVATLLLIATVQYPATFGSALIAEFHAISTQWRSSLEADLQEVFLQLDLPDQIDETYLIARTVVCPHCDGLIPLSPNWRLTTKGDGVAIYPELRGGPGSSGRVCGFEIVYEVHQHGIGTVSDGDATCPFSDCRRVIDGDQVRRQAQEGGMGEQLYAVVFKRRIEVPQKNGKIKIKWERGYRAPRSSDNNSEDIRARLAEKLPEWLSNDIVPTEAFPEGTNDERPIQYGMPFWRDMFSPRQLLCHGTSVEIYRRMLEEDRSSGKLTEMRKAAYVYLALSLDTALNYGNRSCRWDSVTLRVRSIFDRHDFAFCSSYAEMAFLVDGLGYDWANDKTEKCIGELAHLIRPDDKDRAVQKKLKEAVLPFPASPSEGPAASTYIPPPITITCKSGDQLDHIPDGAVDAVVMDPPYYDNVMYAELSDFFYVWLKRTVGYIDPAMATLFAAR